MNIEDLTLKQIRELQGLFSNANIQNNNLYSEAVGKCVIVRSRNEGINFGEVVTLDDTGIVIKDARRIYYHAPKDKNISWYEGVAKCGLDSSSKISCSVDKKIIIEDYSITYCTDDAIKNIKEFKAHAQS